MNKIIRLVSALLFVALLALAQQTFSVDEVTKMARQAYLCGAIDWAAQRYKRDGAKEEEAKARVLAREQGCDKLRRLIGVTEP